MSEQLLNVTISYAGGQKTISLAIKPSLELSDEQVDFADTELRRNVVRSFRMIGDATFYLHEAESGRIMSKESFRDPAYCEHFPRYWYLVVSEPQANGVQNEEKDRPNFKQLERPFAPYLEMEEEDELSLEQMIHSDEHTDTKYHSFSFSCAKNGSFEFVLRHFAFQPSNISRNETPTSQRTHSRSDSFTSADSLESLKLATTFVSHVTPGGVAERAGLETGLVIQMINGASIIRSNSCDIQELLGQCGNELTLLALPKENDDLQFLYPQYTYGSTGEYTTSDGHVSARDFTVVKEVESQNHLVKGQEATLINGDISPTSISTQTPTMTTPNDKADNSPPEYLPPTGLVPFIDDTSQDNSQSCDQPVQSRDQPVRQSSDDILIAGSLQEIENQENVVWSLPTSNKSTSNMSPSHHYTGDSLSNGDMGGLSFTPGLIDKKSNKLYEGDFLLAQVKDDDLFQSSSSQPLESLGRTRTNSILRRHSTKLKEKSLASKGSANISGSMSALDSISDDSRQLSKSVDLGRFKIKKKGDKSLEALTRIQDGSSSSSGVRTKPGSIKRYKSDEHAHRVNQTNKFDGLSESDDRESSWLHQSLDSTTSPQRGSDSSGLSGGGPGIIGLSGQSYDDQRTMSGESGGSTPQVSSSNTAPSHYATNNSSAARKGRKAARGYQMQRAKLHNSRSRISETDLLATSTTSLSSNERRKRHGSETSDTQEQTTGVKGRSRRGQRVQIPSSHSPTTTLEEEANEVGVVKESCDPPQIVDTPTPPVIRAPVRQFSLKEPSSSPPIALRKPRPVSAIEPQATNKFHHQSSSAGHAHNGLLLTSHDQSSRQHYHTHSAEHVPLYKTRSANTPYGEQIVREVNIEEAIARSQMSQGVQMNYGINSSEKDDRDRSKKSREVFKRDKHRSSDGERGLGSVSSALRLSTELLTSFAGVQTSPTHQKKPDVICHGLLSKKQDLTESGKRSHDRSWKQYYAVLSGTRITFYKDKKDSYLNKPCDEPPIEVVPSVTEVDNSYTAKKKMKFVFRVATNQGSEFLLQATDAPSFSRWVDCIQQLNGGKMNSNDSSTNLKVDAGSSAKLTPGSPMLQRRVSSPQPLNVTSKTGKKKDEGSSKGFMGKLRRAFTRDTDEQDFSSFVTFGQSLEDCPVSPDNKRVPLVVESCIAEVEKLGLEVEGLYRKGGIISKINSLAVEMDKGNYNLAEIAGDIHTLCSLLKKFFKELPDPLIPSSMYDEFVACGRGSDEETRLSTLKELVFRLPTAHYHTLRYLMKHLKRVTGLNEVNKMTPRNIATVFGPTLMPNPYPSADGLHLDPNMNASYIIIELLCTQVDVLFDSDLCAEEQRLQEEYTEALQQRDESAVMGSPLSSRHKEHHLEKEKALLKASPLSVRRIQNNLGSSFDGSTKSRSFDGKKRNSLIDLLPPKQLNTLSPQQSIDRATNDTPTSYPYRSIDSDYRTPEPSLTSGSTSMDVKKRPQRQHLYEDVETVGRFGRVPRHSYEDVEFHHQQQQQPQQQRHDTPTDSISRTKNWVKQHNEIGWSTDGQSDEFTGSMWSSKNREKAGGRDKRDRNVKKQSSRSQSSMTSSLPIDHHHHQQQDIASSYRTSSAPHHVSSVPQMMYASTNRHSSGGGNSGNTLSTGSGTSRRVSYATAISDRPSVLSDPPVKDSPHKDRERFTSSDQYGSHRYHGDDSWKSESYSSYHSYTSSRHHSIPSHHHSTHSHHHTIPSHHHGHHRRQYGSLQRNTASVQQVPASLSRRRSSDTPTADNMESRHLSYSFSSGRGSSGRGSGGSLHRTYSSESPPERGEVPIRGSPTAVAGMASNSALKIESYL